MSELNREQDKQSGISRRFRKRYFIIPAVLILLILFIGVLGSSYVLTNYWLPLISDWTDCEIRSRNLQIVSLFPFSLSAESFYFSDRENLEIHLDSGQSELEISSLFSGKVHLHKPDLHGVKVSFLSPSTRSGKMPEGISSESDDADEVFSMSDFSAHNSVVEIIRGGKVIYSWEVSHLQGDHFSPGRQCRMFAEGVMRCEGGQNNPLHIRRLGFNVRTRIYPGKDMIPRSYWFEAGSDFVDLTAAGQWSVSPDMKITFSACGEGDFDPERNLLQIRHFSSRIYKEKKVIGNLQMEGYAGDGFSLEGRFSDLDMEPYLSILTKDLSCRLFITQGEFFLRGSKFDRASLLNDLNGSLHFSCRDISIPVSLDRQSRVVRLILIPVRALPSFMPLISLNWNLKQKLNECLTSLDAVLAGKNNLNFSKGAIRFRIQNGDLKIGELTLCGKDINMESIQGILNLESGAIALRSILLFHGFKIPFRFSGTLDEPSILYSKVLEDFIVLNTPRLDSLQRILPLPDTSFRFDMNWFTDIFKGK